MSLHSARKWYCHNIAKKCSKCGAPYIDGRKVPACCALYRVYGSAKLPTLPWAEFYAKNKDVSK